MALKTDANNFIAKMSGLIKRSVLAVLFVVSFGLMLIGKADNVIVEKTRAFLSDIFVPVFNVISVPASALGSISKNIKDFAGLRKENTKLRKENEVLRELQEYAVKTTKERDQLAALAHFIPTPDASYVSAEVMADMSDTFGQNMIAMAGNNDGVKKGQIVTNGEGLVGKIAYTGNKTSRVILLTDATSRVPITVDGSDIHGILAGDNTPYPVIINVDEGKTLKTGSKIVTSSRAGVYPSGIPVGVILPYSDGEVMKVKTYANMSKLSIVRIVDYSLTGILPENQCTASEK